MARSSGTPLTAGSPAYPPEGAADGALRTLHKAAAAATRLPATTATAMAGRASRWIRIPVRKMAKRGARIVAASAPEPQARLAGDLRLRSDAKRLGSRATYIRSAGGLKAKVRVLRYWTTIPPTAATRANSIMNG